MSAKIKKLLTGVFTVTALAMGTFGTASAFTCYASSPTWSGYWTAPALYVAQSMAMSQCQSYTPFGMSCVIVNCY